MKKYFFYLLIATTISTMAGCNAQPQLQMILKTKMQELKAINFFLVGSGKVTINWGDGKSESYKLTDKGNWYSHSYTPSTYIITITGRKITGLNCFYDSLSSIDVSRNTALIKLECENNQLTNLDVSKNTALTDLWCNNNQLTSLDVSKNGKLTDLLCFDNQLTNLDVSKNLALDFLGCSGNQLTSLNVRKNTALTDLWCNNNQFSTTELNNLFNTLHNKTIVKKSEKKFGGVTIQQIDSSKTIGISGNLGADGCDTSIAVKKGWKIR